ncbi:MAG: hypothetical protein SAJ37_01865 [Oscillatoria sp. PMC 1068.18]|nr:hypothetical protein [Oscillatoria sp. PMC 1068.18]
MSTKQPLSTIISDLVYLVTITGTIAQQERKVLMVAALSDLFTEDERETLQRMLHNINRGRIQLISDRRDDFVTQINSLKNNYQRSPFLANPLTKSITKVN